MAASQEALVSGRYMAVSVGDGDVLELDIHIIFNGEQLAAVQLARAQFDTNDEALSFIQQLDGYADRAHLG